MVAFEFFVHCSGWVNGGYENKHFARTEEEALKIIDEWNENYKNSSGCKVTLISITPITDEEFAEDYIY